jgi:hypothetical protein
MDEVDEFGIPIKKATQPTVDEFGIPVKKKVDTASTSTTPKGSTGSVQKDGSLGTPKIKIKDERLEGATTKDITSLAKPRRVTTDIAKLESESEAFKQLANRKLFNYRQATKIPQEEKKAVLEELKAKKEKEGVINNIKSGLKQGWNAFVDVIGVGGSEETKETWKIDADPFADEKKEAIEFFKEQKIKPTDLQIEQKADEIFIKNKTLQLKQDKINDYLGSLDEQEKTYLEVDAQKRFPTISKKRQDILNRISMNEKALAKSIKNLKNPMTEQDAAMIESEISKITKYLDEDKMLFSKASEELGTAKDEFEAFKRNYNMLENAKARIVASISEGAVSFIEGLDYLGTLGGNIGSKKQSEELFKDTEKARKGIQEYREQYRPDNKELTLDNFFEYSTDLLANQSGTLLTIAGAGSTGGASILGLGQAGQTYAEMRKANKNGTNYAPWQMVVAPAVSGISTGILSASPTFETLKNAKNVWKAAIKDPLAKEIYQKAIKKTSQSITKQVFGDTKKEVVTELLDNTIQNAVKKDILGDKSVGYFDNSWQVLKDTALMTGLLNAGALPQVTMEGVRMFSDYESGKKLNNNGQKIARLLPQLDNENISEASRKAIELEVDKATSENTQIINSTLDKISKLPDSDVKKVVDNNKKQGELTSESEAIKEDNSIEVPAKKILLDAKKQEYENIQKSTNEIINAEVKIPTTKPEVKPKDEVQEQTEIVEPQEIIVDETASTTNTPANFKIGEVEEFHHASSSKRNGRLKPNNAPQFGTGVYFSTNKELVEDEYGKENTTTVKLNVQKPVYTNTKQWNKVEELAVENAIADYNKKNNLLEDEMGYKNNWDISEIPSKFISDAAKELGYDAIIDEGSSQYENEIVVLDESKIIYPEDEKQTTTNAPIDGNVRPTVEPLGEVAIEQKPTAEIVTEESTQSANDVGASEEVTKIKVYRGEPTKIDVPNKNIMWVTPNKELADEYSYDLGIGKKGSLEKGIVTESEIEVPKNPLILNYKGDTEVRGKDIGGGLRNTLKDAYKSGKISVEKAREISEKISKYEDLAGSDLEAWHTKINKPTVTKLFVEIAKDLGFDGIQTNEGRKGQDVGYGLFKETSVFGTSEAEVDINDIENFLNEQFSAKKPTEVKETPKPKKETTSNKYVEKPINEIKTDETRFQNRTELDEEQLKSIKENWNENELDPVVIWKDDKGESFILAGHHRLEAAKQLGKKAIDARYFKGTEAEAIKYATEKSNANRTMEQSYDRAKKLRQLREGGASKKEIDEFLKGDGKNKRFVTSVSYLNPKGKLMDMLKSFSKSGDKKTILLTESAADWIGDARRFYPELTDSHEDELYDYLINKGNLKKLSNKVDFRLKIEKFANQIRLFPNEPLNLESRVFKGDLEVKKEQEIDVVKKEIKSLENEREKGTPTEKRLNEITELISINNKKLGVLNKQLAEAKAGDKAQGDLFDLASAEVVEMINQKQITNEQANEFINDDRKAEEIEPVVEVIESKAKSDKKVELKQVINDVENQIERKPTDRRDDGAVQQYKGKPLAEQENKRPGIVVQAESKMPPTKNFVSKDYEIDEVQKQGVNSALSLFENGGKSFLLADGTGVGKTRQILVTAKEYLDKFGGKVLIISENTTILTKNFANDAKALGIDMNEFEFGTYNDLRTGKKGKDNYGLVIYDEAHNLKNQDSGKAIAAGNIKSKNNMYVTATPMDTIGSAVYFISEVSGVTEEQAYSMLGLNVKKEKDPITGQEIKIVTLQEGVAPADIKRNIVKIREEIIAKGAMLRREYPFYGEFIEDKISLTEEQANEQDEIESSWDDRIEYESVSDDGRVNFRKKMNLSGQKSGELSRWSESTKIKYTFKEVVKAIKDGKKVVVIAEGVNETTITAIDKVVPGFLSELSKMLKAEGYKVAEIFGKSDKGEANDKFQSNEVDVVLGTAKSASTGIDLDDQNGDAPRVLFMVTPNYSGNVFQQILGRVSRRNTKSPAQIRLLFNESNIDARRKQIVNGKLQTLKAIQEGVIDDEIEIDIQEAPVPSANVSIDLEGITLENISEKAFVIKGDTRPIKDNIKAIGGKYNPKYGWMFPIGRKAEVQEMLNNLSEKPLSKKQELKNQANAEVDKIAQKVKDFLPSAKGVEGVKAQGFTQDQIIDLVANAVKALISKGIDINEAIKQVISSIKERFDIDVDENLVKEKLNITNIPQDFERKQGKKSLLTRAATGSDAVLKKAISKYSLDYEVENQEAAKNNADAFVEEVGIEEALDAVRLGKDGKSQIVGAERAFVYAKIIDEIANNINQYTEEERQRLEELNLDILGEINDEFDKETRNAGRFIAALRKVYKGSLGRYNLSKQIADYKALNGGEISDDVLRKFTEANARIKELEAKLDELEKEKEIQEAEQEFKNIVEAVARKNKISATRKISNTAKAKEFANKLRSFKTTQKGTLSASTPMSLAYDGAIEVSAKLIEQGGKLADAIKAGIDFIKGNSLLSNQEKTDTVNQLINAFNQIESQPKNITIDDFGKLKFPASLIREHVENGIDNIDDLVEVLKTDVEEMFPGEDFTDREIRDAVSQYGKISNPTKDEIEIQIGIMKSLGRLISGLEDAYSGKRPLRSGLQRRALTLEERTMQRKLKELLRDLPMDDADLARTWKTALDTIKSRLQNQIADLDKQIELGEKRKAEKKTIEYDDEAKALRDLRDQKRELLDEMVGKPELTEEEKIDKAIILTQNSIEKSQEKIISGEIEYKKKPNPVTSAKLESLRELRKSFQKQIEEMRKDAGLAEMKRLETAKKSRLNRIEDLKRRIREKDYSVREQKPLPIDAELLKIESELQEQKDIYEKEKHIFELNNRSVFRKSITNLVNVVGITRLLKAGGEFSQVLVQQGFLTPEMLVRNPKQFFKAMHKLGKAFVSPDTAKLYEAEMKSNPLYPLMKKTKLSLTGTDHKLDAQEENYQLDLVTDTWNAIGNAINKATKEKKVRTLTGLIKSIFGQELSEKDKKALGDQFKEASVWKMFERGAVTYSNHIKMVKFEQGIRELQKQGKDPINNLDDYKKVANYINVFSGRANLGKAEMISKDAGLLIFSLRNAVSQFQQLNPFYYLGALADYKNVKSISDLKKVKPTVAQKMAVKSFMTSFTAIVAFKLAFMAWANSSADEDEEKWVMETDPRSSDFGKLRKGNKTFDLWHGLNSLFVLYARLLSQETKSIKSGEVKGLGTGYGTATSSDLLVRYGTNKLAPTAGYFWRLGNTHKEVDPNTGKSYRVDKFGNVYGEKEMADLFVPIYWSAVNEIAKEDLDAYEGFLLSLGLLGMSIGTDPQGEKFKDLVGGQEVKRPERPQRPQRP